MTVIKNPARMKKMPTWFRYGIARLKRHTTAQVIHVVMIYVTKTCHCSGLKDGCLRAYLGKVRHEDGRLLTFELTFERWY